MGLYVSHALRLPAAKGFTEVLRPGEYEYRTAEKRRRDGIEVEHATWRAIQALIEEYKLEATVGCPFGREP